MCAQRLLERALSVIPERVRAAAAEAFAIDPRSMVAFRVAMGGVVVVDLAARAADLGAFYTDAGLVPRESLRGVDGGFRMPSLHLLGGSAAYEAVLFVVAGIAAIALAAGIWPRAAAVVSWLFAVSLRHRNPTVLSGGDLLLAVLLCATAIGPVDLRGRRVPVRGSRVEAIGTAGAGVLLAQIAGVYLFAGLIKAIESPAWRDGSAVRLALEDVSVSSVGAALHAHPDLCKAVTWGVLGLEILGPIALFSPWRTATVRGFVALAFVAMHMGISVCLLVGIFPLVSTAAMVAFIPGPVWDRLQVRVPRTPEPLNPRSARALAIAASLFASMALAGNAASLSPKLRIPARIATIVDAAGLAQDWSMYIELTDPSGWYTITAIHRSGATTPLLPEGGPKRYANRRWHAYMTTFARDPWAKWWAVKFLCARGRTADPQDPIDQIEIRFTCMHSCVDTTTVDTWTCRGP